MPLPGAGREDVANLLDRAHELGVLAVEVRRHADAGSRPVVDQHLGSLDPEKSCIEEIRSIRGDLNVDETRQYLARFRFWGDDPFRAVGSCSGGERTRLALAKLLLEPRNLLFMDEPTNHLDIPAAEILEQALVDFEGSAIIVSHDRRFLETVTTRTIAFGEAGPDVYEGSFADWVAMLERRDRHAREQAEQAAVRQEARQSAPPRADSGADRHRARVAQSRELERKRKRVKDLARSVAEAEAELASVRERLKSPPSNDWEQLFAWAKTEEELKKRVDVWTTEWVSLAEELAEVDAEAGK